MMILLRSLAFWIILSNGLNAVASAENQILEGPGRHSSRDILRFLNKTPSATIKNLVITDKLDIPNDQKIGTLNFYNVTFEDGISISGSKENIGLYNSTINGTADFYLANFHEFRCEECKFNGNANFHSVETNSLFLNNSRFSEHAIFVNVRIRELINLYEVSFEKTVDFSGATLEEFNSTRVRNNSPIRIHWAQFGDKWLEQFYAWALATEGEERLSRLKQLEMSLQLWRSNFSQLGSTRDELEANYELIRLKRTYFTSKENFDWWASVILEIPNRYGTRPYRPLVIGLFLIVIFGLIYWVYDPFEKKQEKTLEKKPLAVFSLLYSVDTFIPLINVTGVKEWGWTITSNFRWIELIERLLGLTFGTLAAYSIGTHIF